MIKSLRVGPHTSNYSTSSQHPIGHFSNTVRHPTHHLTRTSPIHTLRLIPRAMEEPQAWFRNDQRHQWLSLDDLLVMKRLFLFSFTKLMAWMEVLVLVLARLSFLPSLGRACIILSIAYICINRASLGANAHCVLRTQTAPSLTAKKQMHY